MPTRTVDLANAITPFKGRDPHSATTVFVFRNLHVAMWSIIANDGPHKSLVVGHAKHVVLDFARWRVNQTGRQRVLREKVKNVHAGVYGLLADIEPVEVDWQRVTYNPYATNHFHLADMDASASSVESSRYAMFDMNGKAWAA